MAGGHKVITAGHLLMMALGTVIGGSFFLGSGVAIRAAGPAILISYAFGGILVYFILKSLSEMTVADTEAGSFCTFAAKAFGGGAGFVVGWVYWTGMILAMSSEAAAASILVREWYPGLSISFLGSSIIIAVTLLNLLGADKLTKLESNLASIKVLAIILFIITGIFIVSGGSLSLSKTFNAATASEPFFANGFKGVAGSMLIVIFSYAGFEIIGLAASETKDTKKVVPKAINYTVWSLVSLYMVTALIILVLIPAGEITEELSPMVAALNRWGIGWAGTIINIVLITAILSTMLAAMFGLGRMIRILALEDYAPKWMEDEQGVPRKGILFSGVSMLLALWFGLMFPQVYMFLVSSGGFALLFTYGAIVATQIRYRKKYGCDSVLGCSVPLYPYASWAVLLSLCVIALSMPFIKGQKSGLAAGIGIVALYTFIYIVFVRRFHKKSSSNL